MKRAPISQGDLETHNALYAWFRADGYSTANFSNQDRAEFERLTDKINGIASY